MLSGNLKVLVYNDPMRLREANPHDAKVCANIHAQEITTGFLRQLGVRFLEVLYTAMITSSNSVCIVAEDEKGQVVGFISGCFHVGKFYKEFFIKHGLKAFLILLPRLIDPHVFRKILETVKYPFSIPKAKSAKDNKLPKAELLSIALKPHIRGTGLSRKLALALFKECAKRGIREIKVVVGASNIRANRFYEKVGFKFHSNISVHGSEISNIYVGTLENLEET